MPSKVRIISPRNSSEWERLVRDTIARRGLRSEETYGGLTSDTDADAVRKKIRTAARREQIGARVYYKECPTPGRCPYDADCTHHVLFTFYPIEEARTFKAQQSARNRGT